MRESTKHIVGTWLITALGIIIGITIEGAWHPGMRLGLFRSDNEMTEVSTVIPQIACPAGRLCATWVLESPVQFFTLNKNKSGMVTPCVVHYFHGTREDGHLLWADPLDARKVAVVLDDGVCSEGPVIR
jgi:hypothetical protein